MQSKVKWLKREETVQQDGMKIGEAVLKEASEKLQAALKKKDFKEGPVAQAIIEAAHKNIGSEDTLGVDKATFVSKHKLCMISSAFCRSEETKKLRNHEPSFSTTHYTLPFKFVLESIRKEPKIVSGLLFTPSNFFLTCCQRRVLIKPLTLVIT